LSILRVAVVGNDLCEDLPGLRLILLLEIAHALPIHRLCHMRPLSSALVDYLLIYLDRRIEIAVDLLGIQAFLQQRAC
jgi:hypothetical protein